MKNNWMMWVLAIAMLTILAFATTEYGKPTQSFNCTTADNGSYNCVLTGGTQ